MRGATEIGLIQDKDDLFQSTLLMRGATVDASVQITVYLISIHAPHARSDLMQCVCIGIRLVISIHAPHARSDGVL